MLISYQVFGVTFTAAFIYNYEKWRTIIKNISTGNFKHEDYTGKKIDQGDLKKLKDEGVVTQVSWYLF